ncbi:MAG: PKD domain-containing protein [Candidatus Bathyarchaeia archaeon]
MKTLNIIYIIRIVLGILAAAIAAFTVSLNADNPLMNGITVALATYLVTYYILKWKFSAKVEQQSKILTMGIGIYFMMFILCWVLIITPFLAIPAAQFTVNTTNPAVGEEITFTAFGVDPDTPVTYYWNFGDQTTLNQTTPAITYNYSTAGDYTVTLTVINNDGLSRTTSQPITVGPLPA